MGNNMEDFFSLVSPTSKIKINIVYEYFTRWAAVMKHVVEKSQQNKKLGYIDLYCGKGKYDDGTESTPVLALKYITNDEKLRDMIQCVFNDKDKANIDELKETLSLLDGYYNLKYEPTYYNFEVENSVAQIFNTINLTPSFILLDPFGIKGITKDLFKSLGKDFGCDIISFFNFSFANRSIYNPIMEEYINSMFGSYEAKKLREDILKSDATSKESIIINSYIEMLKNVGLEFCITMRIHKANNIIYYIVLSAKHIKAIKLMKDVLASIATGTSMNRSHLFLYSPDDADGILSLNFKEHPLIEHICEKYMGIEFTIDKLYDKDCINTPFVIKEYRKVLIELYNQQKLEILSAKKPKGRNFPNDIKFRIK